MQVAKAERLLGCASSGCHAHIRGIACIAGRHAVDIYIDEIGKPGLYVSAQYNLFGFYCIDSQFCKVNFSCFTNVKVIV